MSDYFKKFIDTSGKSLDEIKKIAEKMAKRTAKTAVKTVLDEAEKTVQREIRRKIQEVVNEAKTIAENTENYPKPEKIPAPRAAEKSVPVKPQTLTPDEIAYPHESLPDNLTERETQLVGKISEMRKLREMTYNGYIVQRCAEVTFVLQGDFMADVTDDFPRTAFCAIPTPMYAAMSISQLRTYFTWRTDARRGIFRETDKPYVLLYAYELLNKIGVSSSEDAFAKLIDLWSYCSFAKYLNKLMPRWLKDFYAFNDISNAYPDINAYLKAPKKSAEELAFEEIFDKNFRSKLDFLADNSAYDIRKSIFFSEETKPLLNGAAEFVLKALDRYFTEKELDLCTLLGGQMKKDFAWKPF
ncbi:MAG: TerB N-terminal domain-containing protein, partial [Oscillospiraceae bacterium]